jgi:hypothetical protein
MRRLISVFALLVVAAAWSAAASAQGYAPVVTMTVTLPDGQSKELSVPESGLGQATLKDGTEYGFRPTMQDDRGSVTVVTIFKMSPSPAEIGTVEAKLGAAAVASKTSPAFKIAVNRVGKTT